MSVGLNKAELATYNVTSAFLHSRLEERSIVDWALRLGDGKVDEIKRRALLDLIGYQGSQISEPWLSAWRLIEESWNNESVRNEYGGIGLYDVKRRLRAGDRTGSLVAAIVSLVAPRLEVKAFSALDSIYRKPTKRPKNFRDLFSANLTSGEVIDPSELQLEELVDREFIVEIVHALEGAVAKGISIARRIDPDMDHPWSLRLLHRVYYVSSNEREDENYEPDRFYQGIAPSVKLLHAFVARLASVDVASATNFVGRWKNAASPIWLRLWAALSRDPAITPAAEVAERLLSTDHRCFWNIREFPEIAELRAVRFHEFDADKQTRLAARIRRFSPRNLWPHEANADDVSRYRRYEAVRELRRIEIAGSSLRASDKKWLDAKLGEFPDLIAMDRVDKDFSGPPRAEFIPPNPDPQYDMLAGEERLRALNIALPREYPGWGTCAADWIQATENTARVLSDFESMADGGNAFGHVWDRFGWMHKPAESATQQEKKAECLRVMSLLERLSEATLREAIDGITHWFWIWKPLRVALPKGMRLWSKLWPVAVEVTNSLYGREVSVAPNLGVQSSDEPRALPTLNNPAGRLVTAFLEACPSLSGTSRPFDGNDDLRCMRDELIAATGRAGLIARHRMIESLSYFLMAEPDWSKEHLVTPLRVDTEEAKTLWRAVAERTLYSEIIKIIGEEMVKHATDARLGRETCRSLVFSLILECLFAFREGRAPVIAYAKIQQMLRLLDDQGLMHAVKTVETFVYDLSRPSRNEGGISSAEELLRAAVVPFLKDVWPQEHSLITPVVSGAFARLPAATRSEFANAVKSVERFLAPFRCWGLLAYGLDKQKVEELIDDHAKAEALLTLLDLTIGTTEGSMIPYDLGDALDQIRCVAPTLAQKREFRRLETATRRVA